VSAILPCVERRTLSQDEFAICTSRLFSSQVSEAIADILQLYNCTHTEILWDSYC